MRTTVRTGNALLILILMGIITAAFYQEFIKQGPPCPLCFLQRLGMIGMATGAMMNLRFGVRIRHYALSLFSGGLGAAVSLQQVLMHICPNFPVFGFPVFGLGLYTWAFIAFCCSALVIGFLLFLYQSDQTRKVRMNWLEKLAFLSLILVTVANIVLTYHLCGFGHCPDPPWPPI